MERDEEKKTEKEHGRKAAKSNNNRECYSEIVDSAHSMQRSIVKMLCKCIKCSVTFYVLH